MEILRTENLKKIYKTLSGEVRALDGVSLSVEEGEFAAIAGSSGSGKTTLLNMLGGLDYPTSGQVFIRGKALGEMNTEELTVFRRRNIGFVFQTYNLLPILNVKENITLPLKLDGRKCKGEYYPSLKAGREKAGYGLSGEDHGYLKASGEASGHAGNAFRRPAAESGYRPGLKHQAGGAAV